MLQERFRAILNLPPLLKPFESNGKIDVINLIFKTQLGPSPNPHQACEETLRRGYAGGSASFVERHPVFQGTRQNKGGGFHRDRLVLDLRAREEGPECIRVGQRRRQVLHYPIRRCQCAGTQ